MKMTFSIPTVVKDRPGRALAHSSVPRSILCCRERHRGGRHGGGHHFCQLLLRPPAVVAGEELVPAAGREPVPARGERPDPVAALLQEQERHHLHQGQRPRRAPDGHHEAPPEGGRGAVPVQNGFPGGNEEPEEGAGGSAGRYVLGLGVGGFLLEFHGFLFRISWVPFWNFKGSYWNFKGSYWNFMGVCSCPGPT